MKDEIRIVVQALLRPAAESLRHSLRAGAASRKEDSLQVA